MTDAVVSQAAVEVVRTNLAADTQASQLAVEVLRPNAARGFVASPGNFTLTGKAASLPNFSKRFTLTGQVATLVYVPDTNPYAGAFAISGVAATLRCRRVVSAATGAFSLAGQDSNAGLKKKGAIALLIGL